MNQKNKKLPKYPMETVYGKEIISELRRIVVSSSRKGLSEIFYLETNKKNLGLFHI